MTFRRLAAIAVIFFGASVAWTVLGSSLIARTRQFDERLEREVELLWGSPHRQLAPDAWILRSGVETETVETRDSTGKTVQNQVTQPVTRQIPATLESTRATVSLDLAHRQRGLLWYPTYSVLFKATYVFRNPDQDTRDVHVRLPLPAENALFDDFVFSVNGRPSVPTGGVSNEMTALATVAAGAPVTLDVQYRSRGLRTWTYAFSPTGVANVRDFALAIRTNFEDVDFPAGTISPSARTAVPGGESLEWTFSNLISGQAIGMQMPQKLNPGPFAARVTFFAPVSLLFFLAVMVMAGTVSGLSLHPMHYWFIAAAFFAFHLLLAYLVDHVGVHVAFAASAVVSLALVVSYVRAVTRIRQAPLIAGSAQAIFLVLFSYAFFFEGFTGLAITVGAIITLFVLMQMTARVSWDDAFSAGARLDRTSITTKEQAHADRL